MRVFRMRIKWAVIRCPKCGWEGEVEEKLCCPKCGVDLTPWGKGETTNEKRNR